MKLGKYRHFKGKMYEVIAIGKHSETLEDMVVYRGLYISEEFGKNPVWIRPLKMFTDKKIIDGKEVKRFEFVE